jgi:hypothetical protein
LVSNVVIIVLKYNKIPNWYINIFFIRNSQIKLRV